MPKSIMSALSVKELPAGRTSGCQLVSLYENGMFRQVMQVRQVKWIKEVHSGS